MASAKTPSRRASEFDKAYESVEQAQIGLFHDKWKLNRDCILALQKELSALKDEVSSLRQIIATAKDLRTVREDLQDLKRNVPTTADLQEVQRGLQKEIKLLGVPKLEDRVAALETLMTENNDLQSQMSHSITEINDKLMVIDTKMAEEKTACKQRDTALDTRLVKVERELGSHAEKHGTLEDLYQASKDAINSGLQRLKGHMTTELDMHKDKHGTILERIEALELATNSSMKDVQRDLDFAKSKLNALGDDSDGHKNRHMSVEQRLTFIERQIGDSAEHQAQLLRDLEDNHQKLSDKIKDLDSSCTSDRRLRDSFHSTLEERVLYLERFIGESVDQSAQQLAEAQAKLLHTHGQLQSAKEAQDKTKRTMEQRLEILEKMLDQSADSKSLDAAMARLRECAASVDGEKNAREKLQSIVEARLKHIEQQIGDTAKNQQQALQALEADQIKFRGSLSDITGRVTGVADSRKTVETSISDRLLTLEKSFGELTDKHDKTSGSLEDVMLKMTSMLGSMEGEKDAFRSGHSNLKDRLEYLESSLRDIKQSIAGSERKMQEMFYQFTGDKSALQEHHATVEQRLEYLEKEIGDSADKHTKTLAALEASRSGLDKLRGEKDMGAQHHSNMQQRLEFLEQFVGESVDKNARELEAAKAKLNDLHGHVEGANAARQMSFSSVEQRLAFLEQQIGDSAENHSKMIRDLEERNKLLTANLNDLKGTANAGMMNFEKNASTLEERVNYLEKVIGESANKHAKELAEAKAKLMDAQGKIKSAEGAQNQIKTTIEQRLENLERLFRATTEKHSKDLETTKKNLKDCQGVVAGERSLRDQHVSSTDLRLQALEKQLGEAAKDQVKAMQGMETKHKKLQSSFDEFSGRLRGEQDSKSSVNDRLDKLEKTISEVNAKLTKQTRDIDANGTKLREVQLQVNTEKSAREGFISSTENRIEVVEKQLLDAGERNRRAQDTMESNNKKLNTKIDDFARSLKSEKDKREEITSALEQRLSYLEQVVGESSDKHAKHKKDLDATEKRLKDLQGKLQGAGDKHTLLHGDVQELRQRIGNPEALMRSDYIQNLQQLVAAEQKAREAHEQSIQVTLQGEKKKRMSFEDQILEHVRNHLEQELKARETSNENVTELVAREKAAREQSHQTLRELIQNEREARENAMNRSKARILQEPTADVANGDAIMARMDSLERTISFFDELTRKEKDDRLHEVKRIWDAIDSHTHDLSTIAGTDLAGADMEDGASTNEPSVSVDFDSVSQTMRSVHVVTPPTLRPTSLEPPATVRSVVYRDSMAPPLLGQYEMRSMPTFPIIAQTAPITTSYIQSPLQSPTNVVPIIKRSSGPAPAGPMVLSEPTAVYQSMPSISSVPGMGVRSSTNLRGVSPSSFPGQTVRRQHTVETITCGKTRYSGT